jgi:energy-coupling factor transporter ATP-binding protein EcfA2
MFLKRLVLVNWGNIPNGEFEFGPVNLFSGANGSGKTTAADAIQTLMTASHENLFHYNPGQEETTQRGRGGKRVRTLASYVLGCDDGSYARLDPTDGYIAGIFHPTQGENAEPFTAVLGVRAWLDASGKQALAREELLAFFVLQGVELDLSTFIQTRGTTQQIVLLDEVQSVLVARYGKRVVERYDQKRAYLRRLYAALRGKRDAVAEREGMAAAKAFSRFMAYKPVSGINQFVADEVLERKDLGEAVRSVSNQLKLIHGMERDAQGLKDSAALLEQSGHLAQGYIESWAEIVTLDYTAASAAYQQHQAHYLKARQEREDIERERRQNAEDLTLAEQRFAQTHASIVALEAQRQGIAALQQKDALEGEQRRLEAQLSSHVRELLTQDQQLQNNLRAAKTLEELLATPEIIQDLPQAANLDSQRVIRAARATEKIGDLDLPRWLQRDFTSDLSMLERHLDEARAAQRAHGELVEYWKRAEAQGSSLRDHLADTHHRRRQRYESVTQQHQQKSQEIARLEAKQVVYPAYVERALAAIRTQCPQADARVLCDHVEVIDPRWQGAIEGYLGGARFSLIVDEQYEAQAIRIVRQLQGRDNRARVIQGAKALRDASRAKPAPDSIMHVLKFSHAVAEAFVKASYGTVARVESADELRNTARGVTSDGMGSGNYSMFRCDIPDAELVFGAAARERALRAKRGELEELSMAREQANERSQQSHRLLQSVDTLQPLVYADAIAGVLEDHRGLRRAEMLLQQLDVSEFRSLEAKLELLQQEEKALQQQTATLNKAEGALQTQLKNVNQAIERLSEQKELAQDAMARAEQSLRDLHVQWPEFDLQARLTYAEQEARAFHAERARAERESIEQRLRKQEHELGQTLLQHNQKCRPADAIAYTAFAGNYDSALFARICELRQEIDRIYNVLKNNVLVDKHEQLKGLKTSFNNAFVSHLCQEIHQSIQDGKRQLDQLNKELVNHRFGSDRESFRFAQDWVPEYREYARFFEEVVRNPAIGEETTLFDAPLTPKSMQVRDTLMSLLLGVDEQQSLRELERIADYRNYQRYEIYKEVEGKAPIALSEYGTGSGGQLETPAYIIRAASITSAFRYAEGANHLRMVLVDEAFSKMDETRSREVIDYLTNTLGLQLIFIMPTSKCGPFMDLVSNEFVFAKVPSSPRGQLHTRVLVDRKQCNRPRIIELWARHRRAVHSQAELDFMNDVLNQPAAARKSAADS